MDEVRTNETIRERIMDGVEFETEYVQAAFHFKSEEKGHEHGEYMLPVEELERVEMWEEVEEHHSRYKADFGHPVADFFMNMSKEEFEDNVDDSHPVEAVEIHFYSKEDGAEIGRYITTRDKMCGYPIIDKPHRAETIEGNAKYFFSLEDAAELWDREHWAAYHEESDRAKEIKEKEPGQPDYIAIWWYGMSKKEFEEKYFYSMILRIENK